MTSPIRPIPIESELIMLIAPRSWSTDSAAIVHARTRPPAARMSFANNPLRRCTVRIIGSCSATTFSPNGTVGTVEDGSTC